MNDSLHKRQADLVELFHRAPICKTYGMKMSYEASGSAVFELPYNPNFDHALGGIHGGVMATLLDNAGWFTIAPHFSNWIATVEFNVQLLEATKKIGLRSKGFLVRLGKTLSAARMEVRTWEDQLVAVGSGTFIATAIPFQVSEAKE
jgi:uncharacterized protein (TIGR00369 family)